MQMDMTDLKKKNEKDEKKRTYQSPELFEHGSVEKITQFDGETVSDGPMKGDFSG